MRSNVCTARGRESSSPLLLWSGPDQRGPGSCEEKWPGRGHCRGAGAARGSRVGGMHQRGASPPSRVSTLRALGSPAAEELPLVKEFPLFSRKHRPPTLPPLSPTLPAFGKEEGRGRLHPPARLHPFSPLPRFAHQCPLPSGVNSETPHLHFNIQITHGQAVDVSIRFQGSRL